MTKVTDYLKEGDEIEVKVVDKTDRGIRLSRKVLLEKPEGYTEPPPRHPKGDRKKSSKLIKLIPPPTTHVGG